MYRLPLRHRRAAFVELLYGNTLALAIFLVIGLIAPHLVRGKTPADLMKEAAAQYQLHHWDGAIADLTEALKIDPRSKAIYLRLGDAKIMKKDYQGSIQYLSKAIEIDPESSGSFYLRGYAKVRIGEFEGAMTDYNEALLLNPNLAYALSDRGLLKRKMGDLTGAMADINSAIRIAPGDSRSFYSRGLVHDSRGEYREAIADYTQSVILKPDDTVSLNNLAWMCATRPGLSDSDRTKALAYANKACTLTHWKEPVFIDTLAAAYAAIGQYDDAIKWQLKYVEMAPGEPEGKARLDLYQKHQPYFQAL